MSDASPLLLHQMEIGPMENFVYLIGDKDTREVFVVDPAWQADTILNVVRQKDLKIVGALISHYHFDHTNGIEELLQSADVPVYVNKHDVPYLDLAHDNIRPVDAGQTVKAGHVEVRLVHTPGHTPGSQCFHVEDHLVSGDTLFIGACGRTDLPGGDARQLFESLRTLARFDDRTVLCPGHNYAEKPLTTLGAEKKTNPYLLCDSLSHFLRFRTGVSESRE